MSEKDPGWLRFYDRLGRFLLLVPAVAVGTISLITLISDLINGQLSGERLLSIGGGLVIGALLAGIGLWWHTGRMKRLRRSEQQMREELERYSENIE